MAELQEQLIALGGLFSCAAAVDRIARGERMGETVLVSLLGSLLVRDPKTTLEVYGGDDFSLREGYRALQGMLERDPQSLQRETLRYALSLITLERKLAQRGDLLDKIGSRLNQIQQQVLMFGQTHDNVIASCAALYQDSLSAFRQRILVHGDMRTLEQPANAAKIRALLFAGIRSARLWRQLGGRRWQLLFARRKLLQALYSLQRGQA